MTPEQIIRAANVRWPHQFPDEVEAEIIGPLTDEQWLLVERSNITGDYHLSTHDSMDDLVEYSTRQECAEDWDPWVAVSLISGELHELQRTFGVDVSDTTVPLGEHQEWRH